MTTSLFFRWQTKNPFTVGGEFESSFSELAEQIGCRLLPAVSPTQNAPCEPTRGAWKYRKWNDSSTKLWLGAVLNWSTNTLVEKVDIARANGYSEDPCVSLCSSCLVRHSWQHQRHRDNFACQRRVALLAEAPRFINSKALSRAILAHARSANNAPSQIRFAVGDQVMYSARKR